MSPLPARDLPARLSHRLSSMLDVDGLILALGAATGLATGLVAAALIAAIDFVQLLAFGERVHPLEIVLVPTLGALLVGVLVTYWAYEPSGSGIVRTMEMVALHSARSRRRVPVAGFLATSIALGTGAAGGREGPIVLIGGSLGSLVGQRFTINEEGLRTLMAAGAAAGIGASFNAPIGGMLFAIEVIVGGLRARSLQVIVLASVIGAVTARQLVGEDIIYEPALALIADEAYTLGDPRELLLYALLGIAAALLGIAFLWAETTGSRLFRRLRRRLWPPAVVALGGLVVGLLAVGLPEILGTGDDLPPIDGFRNPIQAMVDGRFVSWTAAAFLLLLLAAKFVATAASVTSGNAVGTFAPALFMGAALGGAFGAAAAQLLPDSSIQPGAFALVGSAAAFAGFARAPLTAILIVFELTGDYGLVLPLMLAAGLATFLADRIQPDSIYTRPLRARGIVYAQPDDVDIMQTVRVREVMTTDHPTVRPTMPLPELRRQFERTRSHGFAVVDDGLLVGVVSVSDLRRANEHPDVRSGRRTVEELTTADVATKRVLTVQPDDPVYRALHRMAAIDVGRMPVVEPGGWQLAGMVRRADVVSAYQRAMARSVAQQRDQQSRRLRDLAGVRFVELAVDRDSEVANKHVREVEWPPRTVLTSIRRGPEIVMPNGDTIIRPGDEVVVLCPAENADSVRRLMRRHPGAEIADAGDIGH